MLKRFFHWCALLALACGAVAADKTLVVEWDFTQGKLPESPYALRLRGAAKIADGGLVVAAPDAKGSGAVTRKAWPALSPKEPFMVEVVFQLDEAMWEKKTGAVLFDNKYVSWPSAKQKEYHNGFNLTVGKRSKTTFRFQSAFGYGDKSKVSNSQDVPLAYGKPHTVRMNYLGDGVVSFELDGQPIGGERVLAEPIAPSPRSTVVGDRVGSSYSPLGGKVLKASLWLLPPPEKLPEGTIACWDFTAPGALDGVIPLTLRGKSKLDGGLVVLENDIAKAGGAQTRRIVAALTPENAFSIEATLVFDPTYQRAKNMSAMIFDNKYVSMPSSAKQASMHSGFQFSLRPYGKDRYQPTVALGFGDKSAEVRGKACEMAPGVPHTVKMLFTAAGKVVFTVDGKEAGVCDVPPGPLAPAVNRASLGDRVGSNFNALGGKLLKVIIKKEKYEPVSLVPQPGKRQVFVFGEAGAECGVLLTNSSKAALPPLALMVSLAGKPLAEEKLPNGLEAGATRPFAFRVDSLLLPGAYELTCQATDAAGKVLAQGVCPLTIVPPRGDFMPVILWGGADNAAVADLGFTHQIAPLYPIRGDYKETNLASHVATLDTMLRHGLHAFASFYVKYRFGGKKHLLQTNREGKVYPREGVEASNPEVVKEYVSVAEQMAKALGSHPAWDVALLNSEVRDGSLPSFGGVEPKRFREAAGFDIPETITGRSAPMYTKDASFPWNRIVKYDRPELVFLRWWWRCGDGWNDLDSALSAALHKHIRHPFTTFMDPAVRVPPQWGSGGNVDMISQWTYTNPDPLKIGLATDELLAMAAGRPGQKVGTMTQAIWYRSAVAPLGEKVANPPEWMAREPNAKFITIAPDFVREAIWLKVARKVEAIMYHGSGSLICVQNHGYRYTNPKSKQVLKETCAEVVRPLGPVLKRIPERPAEIGILESFTANMFASRHFTGGWGNGWIAELHLALQWAGLQPAIFYEDHLLTGKVPATLKVLFVPGCEVLTDKVQAKLQELQRQGVILVGDEFTTPALMVDLRLQSIRRRANFPAESKAATQDLGAEIAEMLADYYTAPVAASNPDLVLRRRGSDAADYVFVINDRRTFGDYLGQWGLVMEKGLPNNGAVTVRHAAGAAYDLVRHCEVPLRPAEGGVRFPVRLGPGGGTLVLLLERPIAAVKATLNGAVARGRSFTLKASVVNDAGKAVPATLPVEVTLTDAAGHRLPFSGYYAAENGTLVVEGVLPTNAAAGAVTCTVRDLASGRSATCTAAVK